MRIRIQQLKLMRIHADPDTDPKPWSLDTDFYADFKTIEKYAFNFTHDHKIRWVINLFGFDTVPVLHTNKKIFQNCSPNL
jgi:hypothetical protein